MQRSTAAVTASCAPCWHTRSSGSTRPLRRSPTRSSPRTWSGCRGPVERTLPARPGRRQQQDRRPPRRRGRHRHHPRASGRLRAAHRRSRRRRRLARRCRDRGARRGAGRTRIARRQATWPTRTSPRRRRRSPTRSPRRAGPITSSSATTPSPCCAPARMPQPPSPWCAAPGSTASAQRRAAPTSATRRWAGSPATGAAGSASAKRFSGTRRAPRTGAVPRRDWPLWSPATSSGTPPSALRPACISERWIATGMHEIVPLLFQAVDAGDAIAEADRSAAGRRDRPPGDHHATPPRPAATSRWTSSWAAAC